MKNLTRRNFLLLSSFSLVSSSISSVAFSSNRIGSSCLGSFHSLVLSECGVVYKEWSEKEEVTPSDYFVASMADYKLKLSMVSKAIELDFECCNFFVVKGLQLSKTEASFFAIIGSELAL